MGLQVLDNPISFALQFFRQDWSADSGGGPTEPFPVVFANQEVTSQVQQCPLSHLVFDTNTVDETEPGIRGSVGQSPRRCFSDKHGDEINAMRYTHVPIL